MSLAARTPRSPGEPVKDSAPSNPVVAPPTGSGSEADELSAVASLAARLKALGARPAVQPTTIAPAPGALLAVHASAALLALGLGWTWPLLGLGLLGTVGLSAAREAEGRHGWLRDWVPRRVGHNVAIWTAATPEGRAPRLLVVAPLDAGAGRAPVGSGVLIGLGATGALGALGIALAPFAPQAGSILLGGAASVLALAALGGLLHAQLRSWRAGSGPADAQLEALVAALSDQPTHHVEVVLAWISGGARCGDGLVTLLRNNPHRLPPERTRALVLEAGALGPALVNVEGRWQRRPVDPLIARAAAEVGLPVVDGITPARRAMDAGWTAAALLVRDGADTALPRLVRQLDQAAGEGRW